ncbi:MAG: hypothetical protein EXR37_02920 [Limnohabitans sp.]|nr:hypothetical protein [Limnohabitans sp.]
MICTSCYLINPSENVFCQNCGSHLPHVESKKPSISPLILANTLDNSSLLISRGPWQMRMDVWMPFIWLAMLVFVITLNNTYALGIMGVGLAFALYQSHDTQQIIQQTIPVELINKTIIAYGPANTTSRFSLPTGVLYLLSDGLYFKSFDSNEEISFIHIEISFTDTAVRKGGLSIFSNWHEIEMNNGMNERFTFTVQNGGEWMLLMKVVRSELNKR